MAPLHRLSSESAKGANKAPRNPPSSFLISCFTFSVTTGDSGNKNKKMLKVI